MQRAAEGDAHLLKAAADAEQRHAALDAGLDQGQRQVVAGMIVRLVPWVFFHAEPRRMHVGARAGEQDAVHDIEQCADIGDLRRAGEHQRQRAGDFRHGAQIALADPLRGEAALDLMGAADHADHGALVCHRAA